MGRAGKITGVILAGLVALGVLGANAPDREPELPGIALQIEQVGYYKSAERDRVMAFRSDRRLTEEEVLALFEKQFRTPGRVFRGVVYSGDAAAPAEHLSGAPNLARALELTVAPPFGGWDWMFMVNPAGQETLQPGGQG